MSVQNLANTGTRIGSGTDPDEIMAKNQYFSLVSFIAPKGARQRGNALYLKFRGSFASIEEAKLHARTINERDPDFDIHIVKNGAWLQLPPPTEVYDEVPMEYNQDKLQSTMEGYYRQIAAQKTALDQRVKQAKDKMKK